MDDKLEVDTRRSKKSVALSGVMAGDTAIFFRPVGAA